MSVHLINLSTALFERLRLKEAEDRLSQALDIAHDLGDKQGIFDAKLAIGEIRTARGEERAAQSDIDEALRLALEFKNPEDALTARRALADLLVDRDPTQAHSMAQDVLQGIVKERDPQMETQAQEILARAFLAEGKRSDALAAIEKASGLTAGPGNLLRLQVEVALTEARIRAAGGDLGTAQQRLNAAETAIRGTAYLALDFDVRLAKAELAALYGRDGETRIDGRNQIQRLEEEAKKDGYLRGVNEVKRRLDKPVLPQPTTTRSPT